MKKVYHTLCLVFCFFASLGSYAQVLSKGLAYFFAITLTSLLFIHLRWPFISIHFYPHKDECFRRNWRFCVNRYWSGKLIYFEFLDRTLVLDLRGGIEEVIKDLSR